MDKGLLRAGLKFAAGCQETTVWKLLYSRSSGWQGNVLDAGAEWWSQMILSGESFILFATLLPYALLLLQFFPSFTSLFLLSSSPSPFPSLHLLPSLRILLLAIAPCPLPAPLFSSQCARMQEIQSSAATVLPAPTPPPSSTTRSADLPRGRLQLGSNTTAGHSVCLHQQALVEQDAPFDPHARLDDQPAGTHPARGL